MKEYQESWKQIGQKCSMLKETVHFKEETILSVEGVFIVFSHFNLN